MKTKRILKVVAAILALILFHFTLTRLVEVRKNAEMTERQHRAQIEAEGTMGIHIPRFTLPGGMML